MRGNSLSLAEARRIALAAQGFDRPRPASPADARHIRRVIQRLGLLQLDFVNVLIPAHYLIIFSRLGGYPTERFDRLVYRSGEFTEQWAHEASIVPAECWPLLAHRRRGFRPWPNSPIMKLANREQYLAEVLRRVRRNGPLTSQDLPAVPGPKRNAGDWHRSIPRSALEYHFGRGDLAVADRLGNFQRVYDLPHRLIAGDHYKTRVSDEDAQRELLRTAAVAYGIATVNDLADYHRMTARDARPRLAELEEEGVIRPVTVDGWKVPAYLCCDARIPRGISASALLSPFDPLVWYRRRAERLFSFYYRIEIYVPEDKRRWGYYVLPFLLDDQLVARVDLKADRRNRTLLVQAAHAEDAIDTGRVTEALAQELQILADWLGLETIKVRRRGVFARALADSCR